MARGATAGMRPLNVTRPRQTAVHARSRLCGALPSGPDDGIPAGLHAFGDGQRNAEPGVWIEVGRTRQGPGDLPGGLKGDGDDPLVVWLALLGPLL